MSSHHPRASALLARGVYRHLSSFREFESRVATLSEELERGDAFEIFIEAYIHTTPLFQAADVWLVGQVPVDVRRTLNLPADAKGIDGVLRTKTGQNVPYQVKFRIGRPALCFAEVAPFLGVTERADDRLLISNTDSCAADIINRDGLRLLRGSDFDALTAEDLAAINGWLEERPVVREPATPRPDQHRALARIADTLRSHNRATVVMPCGTGKTLVQLWAAEQHGAQTVLVLVPSLALLSQTLDAWSRHTSWGDRFEYLCVCSDPTVSAEQDAIAILSTDVPFHVDTDPAIVRRFLNHPATGGVRVVLSTYQSAPVVAKGVQGLAPFDLGIFDEAHKTTGVVEGTFAFALDDARLRIRKRLFFTATPRHIDIRRRDREGDFRVVSMDDPAVYGPRAYTQTFADAVALRIICDYRVVVAVVDPGEVDSFAMRHGITLVGGDQQATRWVATQVAVRKAIAETGAQKVITFHSRVAHAKTFAGDTPSGIGQYLDGFIVGHVNGAQRVADRKDILSGFRDAQRRLVTNARCLTEGVDLPAVDMVVFNNPRRSRVDIVQAVGRAMRKPRNGTKALGYVVVPVLLAPHETADLAEACAETDWEDIVDVLAALREQDARLDEIIGVQQVVKGRGEAFNPRAFAERVQVLGPLVGLEVLERHIAAIVLESLGVSWDERYGQLVEFKLREGHCNVPIGYPKNPQLAGWLRHQREFKRRGTLSSDRIRRLDGLGIAWDPYDAAWEDMFRQLETFKAREGHCNVSQPSPLHIWLNNQRRLRRGGKLSAERTSRLERIGVTWELREAFWEEMVQALVAFRQMHGHCNVPARYPENPQLGTWLDVVRQSRKEGTLSPDRIARLEALGVAWNMRDRLWEDMFQALVAFKAQHGNCYVPQMYPESPRLLTWMNTQRARKRRGSLSQERVDRLTKIEFPWDPHDSFWEDMFQCLGGFKAQHGHCKVPRHYPESPQLSTWVQTQRTLKARGRLSGEDIGRLEELGFVWQPHRTVWNRRLEELAAFKVEHGHCNVPADYPENPSLGSWLDKQRQERKHGTLAQESVARLDALGVVWERLDDFWEHRFRDLTTFKMQHGHCNVPVEYPQNPALGTWLNNQRRLQRSLQLSPDRVNRLEEVGVLWEPQGAVWEKRFQELRAFKKDRGHCDVPQSYSENRSLGTWLSNQRQFRRRGTLSQDRIDQLEALGVVWNQGN
jgi:superfamily II DNA or RNA helicase